MSTQGEPASIAPTPPLQLLGWGRETCILLQRVGGDYRFIHPLFLDYFASLSPSSLRSISSSTTTIARTSSSQEEIFRAYMAQNLTDHCDIPFLSSSGWNELAVACTKEAESGRGGDECGRDAGGCTAPASGEEAESRLAVRRDREYP